MKPAPSVGDFDANGGSVPNAANGERKQNNEKKNHVPSRCPTAVEARSRAGTTLEMRTNRLLPTMLLRNGTQAARRSFGERNHHRAPPR
jgi:hypothetical protein